MERWWTLQDVKFHMAAVVAQQAISAQTKIISHIRYENRLSDMSLALFTAARVLDWPCLGNVFTILADD